MFEQFDENAIGKPYKEAIPMADAWIMLAKVLKIEEGQSFEAMNEPNGGLRVVVGVRKCYAVNARIFRRKHAQPGHRRIAYDDVMVNEMFGLEPGFEYYLDVRDDAVVMDGRGYHWPE